MKVMRERWKLDSNISNWKPAFDKLNKYLKSTQIGKTFSESVIEDVHRFHKKPIFFDYYTSAYNQLGLFGFRIDKLSDKNRYSNSIEDSFHSFYGANSNCFITNDKTLYYRSETLFDAFDVDSVLIGIFKEKDQSNFELKLNKIIDD